MKRWHKQNYQLFSCSPNPSVIKVSSYLKKTNISCFSPWNISAVHYSSWLPEFIADGLTWARSLCMFSIMLEQYSYLQVCFLVNLCLYWMVSVKIPGVFWNVSLENSVKMTYVRVLVHFSPHHINDPSSNSQSWWHLAGLLLKLIAHNCLSERSMQSELFLNRVISFPSKLILFKKTIRFVN